MIYIVYNKLFRAESETEKNAWVELIEDAKADSLESRLKHRQGSMHSIGLVKNFKSFPTQKTFI